MISAALLANGLLAAALAVGQPVTAPATTPLARDVGARAGCHAMPVVAHRGVHSRHTTEDSAASFGNAVAKGADVVEGDLHLSADGTWVLMHDDTVDRTTHGHGRVGRLHDDQLARIRYNDGRVGVSTLAQGLDALAKDPRVGLQVEVKPDGVGTPALGRLVAVLDAYGVRERTTVTSFHKRVLARLRRVEPSLATALILTHRPAKPWRLRTYGRQVDLEARAVSAAAVRGLHRAGIQVHSWTVDSHRTWHRVMRAGVDAVITDHVRKSRRWCG